MNSPVRRQPASILIIALLLTACGGQPISEPGADTSAPVAAATPAAISDSEGEFTDLLNHVENLLQQRHTLPAASILTQIERGKLTVTEQVRHSLLWADLYFLEGDVKAALVSLNLEQARFGEMSLQSRRQVQQRYLRLLTASGATLAVARIANQWLADTSDAEHRAFLIENIWHKLQSSPVRQLLNEREVAAIDPNWRGWLDLGLIAARVADGPAIQVAEIRQWQQRYSNHPLAGSLPGGLDLLDELARSRPQRVALVLPLGNALKSAAQAVLDGYLAMQYESAEFGWESQQLLVLDSDSYPDINTAYQAAVGKGAELVIGPLAKETLQQWVAPQIPGSAPLLALNWLEQQPVDSSRLYQLSLAPEDEARQIAQLAFEQGARQALLIRPAGSWGDSMSRAFEAHWRGLRGDLRSTAVYSSRSDYSSSIKAALKLTQSEARARKIRQLMGTEIEFSPRRRQDIDSVFLLSGQPAEARSIKPLIAFHYAADLPVYSTSHVFSGRPSPRQDRDLDGIRLLQMPWLLQQDGLKKTLKTSGAKENLAAMYALGVDAFLLHWRLGQLGASPNNSIRGHTGLLSMDQSGRIHRQLLTASFSGGIPVSSWQ